MDLESSWNATDSTYHIGEDDEIELRKQVLRFIFCSTWLGVLSTVALAFLALSTAAQRRSPIFAIQAIGLSLAITYNTCEIVYSLTRFGATFAKPSKDSGTPYLNLVRLKLLDLTLEHLVPIICDSALLIKVHSFFPYPLYSRRRRIVMLCPLVLLLCPRIALTVVAAYAIWHMETDVAFVPGQTYPVDMGFRWVPLVQASNQAEFTIQAFYCLYAALLLLYKAAQFTLCFGSPLARRGVRQKMRFFCEALLMTFIPPVAFAIAAAGTLQCSSDHYCYYREMTGTLLNTSVLFGLLATSWSSIRARHAATPDDTELASPSQIHGVTLPTSLVSQAFEADLDEAKGGVKGTRHQPVPLQTAKEDDEHVQPGCFGGMCSAWQEAKERKAHQSALADCRDHTHRRMQAEATGSTDDRFPAFERRRISVMDADADTASAELKQTRDDCEATVWEDGMSQAEVEQRTRLSAAPLLEQVWSECHVASGKGELPLHGSTRFGPGLVQSSGNLGTASTPTISTGFTASASSTGPSSAPACPMHGSPTRTETPASFLAVQRELY